MNRVRSALGENKDKKYLWIECVPNEDVPNWPEDLKTEQLLLAPHWYASFVSFFCKTMNTDNRTGSNVDRSLRYDLNALFNKTFG